MAYRNAQEIFPEGLLKQIQRYVSGETIYVPAREEKKAWGGNIRVSAVYPGQEPGYSHSLRPGREHRAAHGPICAIL